MNINIPDKITFGQFEIDSADIESITFNEYLDIEQIITIDDTSLNKQAQWIANQWGKA